MAERQIYLVRHGVAEDVSPTGHDVDRRLTDEGREKMARAARGLEAAGVHVDLLVSSPLVRAVETADVLADVLTPSRREVWEEMACGVDEIELTARLEVAPASADVLLVGHEPDIGEILAYWLAGRRGAFSTHVRKGGVICLRAGGLPPGARATLEWAMTAKQLGRLARS